MVECFELLARNCRTKMLVVVLGTMKPRGSALRVDQEGPAK